MAKGTTFVNKNKFPTFYEIVKFDPVFFALKRGDT